MIAFWVWLAGAVLMAALGPPPRWLAAGFQMTGGRELDRYNRWMLWAVMVIAWPAALVWFARDAMYGR
ncbi:hypothetical protein [Streptomyces longwoodensis]|uniref:hypothetical protein n=1 Tax=Streptomyces longwoodensis TaxID=68231 RepID=UPI0036F6E960